METPTEPPQLTLTVDRVIISVSAVSIVLLALFVLSPLWAPIVFATWAAVLLDPLTARVTLWLRGRRAFAAGLASALVALLLVPLGLLLASLLTSVMALLRAACVTPGAPSGRATGIHQSDWGSAARRRALA